MLQRLHVVSQWKTQVRQAFPILHSCFLTILTGALAGGNPEGHSDVVPVIPAVPTSE